MSPIHLEIFDPKRLQLFKRLKAFENIGYLAGGTALALQINHRKSYDFDIFTSKEITNSLKLEVQRIFGGVSYTIDSGDQLSFATSDAINVTFLWYYFKPLKPLIATPFLPMASIEDIAADKAYTMGRRTAWRDYVDIYWLLRKRLFSIENISSFATKKFRGVFNEAQFLEQLTYFKDVAITPIEFTQNAVTAEEIQQYLVQTVSEYVRKKL